MIVSVDKNERAELEAFEMKVGSYMTTIDNEFNGNILSSSFLSRLNVVQKETIVITDSVRSMYVYVVCMW